MNFAALSKRHRRKTEQKAKVSDGSVSAEGIRVAQRLAMLAGRGLKSSNGDGCTCPKLWRTAIRSRRLSRRGQSSSSRVACSGILDCKLCSALLIRAEGKTWPFHYLRLSRHFFPGMFSPGRSSETTRQGASSSRLPGRGGFCIISCRVTEPRLHMLAKTCSTG